MPDKPESKNASLVDKGIAKANEMFAEQGTSAATDLTIQAADRAAAAARNVDRLRELQEVKARVDAIRKARDSGSHFFKHTGHAVLNPRKWLKNSGSLLGRLKNAVIEGGGAFGSKIRVKPAQIDDYYDTLVRAVTAAGKHAPKSAALLNLMQNPVARGTARTVNAVARPLELVTTLYDMYRGWNDLDTAMKDRFSIGAMTSPGTSMGADAKLAFDSANLLRKTAPAVRQHTDSTAEMLLSALEGLLRDQKNRRILDNVSPLIAAPTLAADRLLPQDFGRQGQVWDVGRGKGSPGVIMQTAEKVSNAYRAAGLTALKAATPGMLKELVQRIWQGSQPAQGE